MVAAAARAHAAEGVLVGVMIGGDSQHRTTVVFATAAARRRRRRFGAAVSAGARRRRSCGGGAKEVAQRAGGGGGQLRRARRSPKDVRAWAGPPAKPRARTRSLAEPWPLRRATAVVSHRWMLGPQLRSSARRVLRHHGASGGGRGRRLGMRRTGLRGVRACRAGAVAGAAGGPPQCTGRHVLLLCGRAWGEPRRRLRRRRRRPFPAARDGVAANSTTQRLREAGTGAPGPEGCRAWRQACVHTVCVWCAGLAGGGGECGGCPVPKQAGVGS